MVLLSPVPRHRHICPDLASPLRHAMGVPHPTILRLFAFHLRASSLLSRHHPRPIQPPRVIMQAASLPRPAGNTAPHPAPDRPGGRHPPPPLPKQHQRLRRRPHLPIPRSLGPNPNLNRPIPPAAGNRPLLPFLRLQHQTFTRGMQLLRLHRPPRGIRAPPSRRERNAGLDPAADPQPLHRSLLLRRRQAFACRGQFCRAQRALPRCVRAGDACRNWRAAAGEGIPF